MYNKYIKLEKNSNQSKYTAIEQKKIREFRPSPIINIIMRQMNRNGKLLMKWQRVALSRNFKNNVKYFKIGIISRTRAYIVKTYNFFFSILLYCTFLLFKQEQVGIRTFYESRFNVLCVANDEKVKKTRICTFECILKFVSYIGVQQPPLYINNK